MGWAAAAQAAVGLISAYQQKRAADKQGEGAGAGLDWIKDVYGDAQGNLSPFIQGGQSGLADLLALNGGDYSKFWNGPDVQAGLRSALYGMDNSAAGRLRIQSPGYEVDRDRALMDHTAGYLGNYRNSLMGLAQLGSQSASSLGNIGVGAGGQIMQGYLEQGLAAQQGAGAMGGGLGVLAGLFGQMGGGSSFGSTTNFGGQPNTQIGGNGMKFGG